MNVSAEPADGNAAYGLPASSLSFSIGAPFKIEGLLPGRYTLRVGGVGTWLVKSIVWNGDDHTHTGFDASSGRDFDGVVITFTDKLPRLSGTLRRNTSDAASGAIALAFPVESEQWSGYGLTPSRIRTAVADTAGDDRFSLLPAGEALPGRPRGRRHVRMAGSEVPRRGAGAGGAGHDRLGRKENPGLARGEGAMTSIVTALLIVASLGLAQQPTRDVAVQPAAAGTARLSGVVVSADRVAQPVRRAIVTISGASGRRSTITDDDGKFTFGDLAAGSFTVSAARRAYLTSAYGTRYPGDPGTPIHLADGAHANDIRIVLPKGAVLTGTITDLNGQPAPSVPVTAYRLAPVYAAAGSATTDDRGEDPVFGLVPGTYVVVAVPRPVGTGDMAARSEREVDAILGALARRGAGAATAARPGATETAPLEVPPQRASSFAPFYYPGTPVASDAGRIAVAAGETRGGLDFTVGLAATASVAGVVSGSDGRPAANVQVSMLSIGPPIPLVVGTSATGTMRTGSDGSFTFGSVTPGSYRITARSTPGGAAPTAPMPLPTGSRASEPLELAVADVTVNGEDVAGVAMTLQPGLRLTGKVVFEGTSKIPATLEQSRVVLHSFPQSARAGSPSLPIRADGTFDASNLLPGSYVVDVTLPKGVSDTWWVRSAIVRGQDVMDVPLELAPGAGPSELVLTLSDRRAALSGVVRGDRGAVNDAVVIAFSANPAHWRPNSRRVRAARPGTDGRYEISDLPSGDYLLVAVRQTIPDAWHEAAFLEQLVARAIRIVDRRGRTQDFGRTAPVAQDFSPASRRQAGLKSCATGSARRRSSRHARGSGSPATRAAPMSGRRQPCSVGPLRTLRGCASPPAVPLRW